MGRLESLAKCKVKVRTIRAEGVNETPNRARYWHSLQPDDDQIGKCKKYTQTGRSQ